MRPAALEPVHPPGVRRGAGVLVMGMGRSGHAAASLILAAGAVPLLADDAPEQLASPAVDALMAEGARRAGDDALDAASLVVVSPGVPGSHPILAAARMRRVPVWGELELAYRYCPARMLAVTGSDGKSTTCALLAHLLSVSGKNTILAGNIGTPLSALVSQLSPDTYAVVEVSSYQLETAERLRPWIAALLNVAPDHLERHGSLEDYARVKARLFARQGPGDWCVVNGDRPDLAGVVPETGACVLTFSATQAVRDGAFVREGWLCQAEGGQSRAVLPLRELSLPGHHNLENALAALAVLLPLALPVERLAEGLRSFRGLPHRIEEVGTVRGVRYVNDSKATNVHAASTGLASMSGSIVLLAGGKDKGLSFAPLADAARGRVRVVIAYGQAGPRIARELSAALPTRCVDDLAAAVTTAAEEARPGEVVLLSPACSSFDAYRSFEERGDHFKALVRALPGFRPQERQESPKKFSR